MMMGFENVMYCTTFGAMALCVLLDYLLAYGVMGLGPGSWGGRGVLTSFITLKKRGESARGTRTIMGRPPLGEKMELSVCS